MFETQTGQTRLDEQRRCRDRVWLSMDDQKRFGFAHQADIQDKEGSVSNSPAASLMEMVRKGQHVYLPGNQFIGLITNLLLNPEGQLSYLAIRTARLFGRHKVVPITAVSMVHLDKVLLSISREQFFHLPGFQPDSTIVEEVDREIWNDTVLRFMDYHEIDIRSLHGNITLTGHVISSMNQWRADMAAKNVPGM